MAKITHILAAAALMAAASTACGSRAPETTDPAKTPTATTAHDFSADSAYGYVAQQVAFGPRVPGTAAHAQCRQWLADKLAEAGADTVEIIGEPATASDGTTVEVRNILGRFNSDNKRRILLLAHYDSRPWADHDPDPSNRRTPIDGANDGASGVAVLLEIARQIGMCPPGVGVDILLTDVEDYGTHAESTDSDNEDSWCIGSAQFAGNLPYRSDEVPYMGILLDMVGGADARFPMELFSAHYAQAPTAKVWSAASRLGLEKRFPSRRGGAITDDHLPLIRAGIPVTDIIESANPSTGSFPPTWHTLADNLSNIDPSTMADVGMTVLEVIYSE